MSDQYIEVWARLEGIDLQLQQGVDALFVVAEKITNDETGEPEGPALYFIAEAFRMQQLRLRDCIADMSKVRKAERLQTAV